MSAQLMSLALSMPGLKPTEKLVLVKLCDHANESGEAWPLKKNLAETLGIDRKSVYRAYDRLLELGLIEETGANRVLIDLNKSPKMSLESPKMSRPKKSHERDNLEHESPKMSLPSNPPINPNKPQVKKIEKKEPIFSRDEIEDFQRLYPHRLQGTKLVKQSVKEIERAFEKARKDTPQEVIIGGLEKAKAAWDNPKYIPEMTTWLNNRRWEREFANVSTTNASNTNPTSNQGGSNGRAQQQSRTALDFLADRARRDFGNQSEAMPPRDADNGSTLDFSRNSEGRYGADRRV